MTPLRVIDPHRVTFPWKAARAIINKSDITSEK
jgi:hypothetical protein